MNLLLHLTAYEIQLYLRSKIFWLFALLIVIALAFFPSFDFLLIQFLVISVLVRDKQSDFTGILASIPHQTAKLCLARALAAFLLLLGLWPFMLFTVGIFPGMEPAEWLLNPQLLAFLTLKYIIICMVLISVVFLLGLTMGSSWYLYLIITVCWATEVFIAGNLSHFPSWTAFLVFGSGVLRLMAPSTAVGYFPNQILLPWLAAAYIVTAIFFLITGVICQALKRKESILRLKWLPPLALIWITVCLITGIIVHEELKNREKGFRLGLQEMERSKKAVVRKMAHFTVPRLESYRLAIKLRTATHHLQGTAYLKMNPADSAESIQFTLRNYFRVKAVTEAGEGIKLKWRREGSILTIFIPEYYRRKGTITLKIVYWGLVWEWFPPSSVYTNGPMNFVSSQFSLLRSGYAWYPVPGIHSLYQRQFYTTPWQHSPKTTLLADRVSHPTIAFDLTVDLDTDDTAVSNLEYTGVQSLAGEFRRRYSFSSLHGRDIFLLVGPYHYEKRPFPAGRIGFIEVYCYRQHQKRLAQVLESLTKPYLFYENLFQSSISGFPPCLDSGKVCTVVEIPPFAFLNNEEGSVTLTDTVVLTEDLFFTPTWHWTPLLTMQANKGNRAVLQRWWQEDITIHTNGWMQNGDITKGVLIYLYALYIEKTRNQELYEHMKENLLSNEGATEGETFLPSLIKGPIVRDVFMTLDMIGATKVGEQAIRKIVNKLYRVYANEGRINQADFILAIEAETGSLNLSPNKVGQIHGLLKGITMHGNNPETWKMIHNASINNYTFRPEDWLP